MLTRAQWEHTADQMLLAVRPYATASHALINLPGPQSRSGTWSDGLEGFARTFLLAAFRLAGGGGSDPHALASWYAAGLSAGTDPSSASRWPRLDEIGQAKVEAASVAIALHETKPLIWDQLDSAGRERILNWLGAFAGAPVPDNNWVWFRAVVAAFCRSVGARPELWSAADIEHAIDRTESWYAGDGWYTDGGERNFDHYSGWAMQLYPLWFCRIAGSLAPHGLQDRYRTRLRSYLQDAAHLVGGDGAPLFQGRSLTYRFAALAPFWTGALFDATPLPPGVTRRISNQMLSYFLDAGCLRRDGTLSIGWQGEYLPVRQLYSGPGSPYWAAKGFAGLLLPADHPVWLSAEEPMPVERGDFVRVLSAPGWLASGTSADGIVRVANHGTDHTAAAPDDPFYCRWTYSTRTAPDLSGDVAGTVTVLDAAGHAAHRRPVRPLSVSGDVAISRHQAHWPAPDDDDQPGGDDQVIAGPWLTTASAMRGCWEVRAVRIDPPAAGLPAAGLPAEDPPAEDLPAAGPAAKGAWTLRIGGWAVAGAVPPVLTQQSASIVSVSVEGGLTSVIHVLRGKLTPAVHRPPDPNAFGPYSAIPYLRSSGPVRYGDICLVATALTTGPAGPGEPPRLDPSSGDVIWPGLTGAGPGRTSLLPALLVASNRAAGNDRVEQ